MTWIPLELICNSVKEMQVQPNISAPSLTKIADNDIWPYILFSLSRLSAHQQDSLRKMHTSCAIVKAIIAMYFSSGHLIVSALRGHSHDVSDLVAIIVACQHGKSASIILNWHNREINGALNYVTLLDTVLSDMKGRNI